MMLVDPGQRASPFPALPAHTLFSDVPDEETRSFTTYLHWLQYAPPSTLPRAH